MAMLLDFFCKVSDSELVAFGIVDWVVVCELVAEAALFVSDEDPGDGEEPGGAGLEDDADVLLEARPGVAVPISM